jgi:hypothetical protein
MAPSDKTALQAVVDVDEERKRLEQEAEVLSLREDEREYMNRSSARGRFGMFGYRGLAVTSSTGVFFVPRGTF